MPWAGQTWMTIIQESSYGSYNSGGSKLYPVLYQGDSFTMRPQPLRQVIRTADGGNRRRAVVAARKAYRGTLKTLLYPTQAAYWVTALTPSSNVLPSYSIQYWDSVRAQRYLGASIEKFRISSSAETDYVTLSVDWVAQTLDATFTTFTQPAESNYPTEVPYEHFESASNLTLSSTAITKYKSIDVSISNMLKDTWDELSYISALYYCGRDIDFSFGPQYLATTYRTDYEAQTALTLSVGWSRSAGSHSLTLNCETNSYVSSIDDSLPLDGPGYQNVGVQVFYDPTTTTDVAITAS